MRRWCSDSRKWLSRKEEEIRKGVRGLEPEYARTLVMLGWGLTAVCREHIIVFHLQCRLP